MTTERATSSPEIGGWFNDLQNNPITYFALCAGAGIGTLGLDSIGWECVGAIEKLSVRREVLSRHHPRAKILDDVFAVQGGEIPVADVWIVTAPCQELSAANPDGEGLTINHPWFGCTRLLRECRSLGTAPSLVLLEQVPPLVRHKKRAPDWEMVKRTVGECGYRLLDHKVIDALPIYGRQTRERVLQCGRRHGSLTLRELPRGFWEDAVSVEVLTAHLSRKISAPVSANQVKRFQQFIGSVPRPACWDGMLVLDCLRSRGGAVQVGFSPTIIATGNLCGIDARGRVRTVSTIGHEWLMGLPRGYTEIPQGEDHGSEKHIDEERRKMVGEGIVPHVLRLIGRGLEPLLGVLP